METSLNFKATPVRTVEILERQGRKYKPVTAQFVRMEQKNPDDYKAIENIHRNWRNADYTYNILKGMDILRFDLFQHLHIFALTKQKDNFQKLDPKKILGIIKFTEYTDKNLLNFIQVRPKDINSPWNVSWNIFKKPQHKHVGKSMLDSLKSIFNNKPMELFSNSRSINFYKRNNFEYIQDKGGNNMLWYPTLH